MSPNNANNLIYLSANKATIGEISIIAIGGMNRLKNER